MNTIRNIAEALDLSGGTFITIMKLMKKHPDWKDVNCLVRIRYPKSENL